MTFTRPLLALLLTGSTLLAHAAGPLEKTECIAPAKPGGGFDLTCKLVQSGLHNGKFIADPMRVTYMPGGIGAVAYNAIVAQRPDQANTIVAFSSGSLLNLAQGKFGRYNENDVRWLAAIGTDYGAITVAADSPYKTLKDVLAAVKADPTKVVFGAGGTVGSQDWMKAALSARSAGVDPRAMRFVAFEGGGEALTALQGGHIHVFAGDAAEAQQQLKAGSKIRILAVMSDKRLPGELANVPTAKEAGLPGIEAYTWVGAMVNAKTPPDIAAKLAGWFTRIANQPETQQFYANLGATAMSGGPAQMKQFQADEIALWKRIATQAKIELQ